MADPVFNFVATNPFGLSNAGIGYDANAIFTDIDGDGDQDAFIGNSDGSTLFFRNTGTANNPVFAAPITNPFGLRDVGFDSSPSLVDIDGDGDQDAFIGNSDGNTLFFRNTGTASNPVFASPTTNPFGFKAVHYAAVPTFADIDGDGDWDAFVGDYYGTVHFFKNVGTAKNPTFAAPITQPFGLSANYFADPTFVDIDNDGDLDAFIGSRAGPFSRGGDDETHFFRNIGTVSNPKFYFAAYNPFGLKGADPNFVDIDGDRDLDAFTDRFDGNTDFFKNTGIGFTPEFNSGSALFPRDNVGRNPNPSLVDIDGDGDLDAFVGDIYGDVNFFKNTGTASNPVFVAANVNPFGLSNVGYGAASPTFVDIDNDGDQDAFIGNFNGNTLFFRNTGTANNPVFAAPITNPFGLRDVGTGAQPAFADIDGDGDLDAFVGGNDLFFFRNIGTANNPSFAAPTINPFGLGGLEFNFVDFDRDGDLDAFASDVTEVLFFKNTGTVNNPVFAKPVNSPFGLSSFYANASPVFADIEGDGDLDAFIGFDFYYAGIHEVAFFVNNQAPNVANLTVAEKYTKNTPLNLKNIVISDPDSPNVTVTLTLSNSAAGSLSTATSGTVTSSYNASTGKWTASGALADVNTLLAGVIFTPAANFIGTFTINTSISDGAAEPLTGSKSFTAGAGAFLVSTAGNNILTGTSSNNDTVTYVSATGPVTVSLNITTQQNTVNAGLDTITQVENLIGSAFADNLTGNVADNVLEGKAGNDMLLGWSGADTMIGGPGNDTYFVENTGDVVYEKLNEGTDTVSSRLTYILPANVENLILTGTAAINGTGNSAANVITGNSAANKLNGLAGNDILNGANGNDLLNGGAGTNTLTGGLGNDIFRFTTKVHADTVADYNVANDTVQLDNAVFTALTATGTLAAARFRVGAQALDANDNVIYNKTAGTLWYDADGNGAGAAVQIAVIGSGLNLTHVDIVVI